MNIVNAAEIAKQALEYAESNGHTVQVFTEKMGKVNALEILRSALKKRPIVIETKDINWKLLRRQKVTLLNTYGKLDHQEQEAMDGIIHLLDAVQDNSVDQCGVEEKEVFGTEKR